MNFRPNGTTSAGRQQLLLSNGEAVGARLIVLANGLNVALRHSVGIGREILSPTHSVSIGVFNWNSLNCLPIPGTRKTT